MKPLQAFYAATGILNYTSTLTKDDGLTKADNAKALLEMEHIIATDAKASLLYALKIKRPFRDGELAISLDPECARIYATDVIGGKFLPGEPVIATSDKDSYYYARYALKAPFPAGEQTIYKNEEYLDLYLQKVVGRQSNI